MGEREFGRSERVAEQLQKELAWALERDMQDPRARFVTIARVKMSKDLSYAKVFVTVREGDCAEEAARTLNRASGFLRARLAERLRMRYLPRLRFVEDKTLDEASRIEALLQNAKSSRR
jgi:ribosome-binding factor A